MPPSAMIVTFTNRGQVISTDLPGGAVDDMLPVTASLDGSGKYLKLTANNTDTSFQVLGSTAATALGVTGTGTSTNLLQAVAGLSGTSLTVQANGGGATTVQFGTGGGQVSTLAELQSALANSGVSASNSGGPLALSVAGSSGTGNALITSGSALGAFGMSPVNQYGQVSTPTPDATRASLQDQYNNLLQQIDTLAGDSSYNGLNLLNVTAFWQQVVIGLVIAPRPEPVPLGRYAQKRRAELGSLTCTSNLREKREYGFMLCW